MRDVVGPASRRARNKQDKLARITAAASELFGTRGVDDVTTQEIADLADVGAGTLYLYARSKGELLLLVQNARYEAALEQGVAQAGRCTSTLDAVLALVEPVVRCNRTQVDNGRTYLREMVFGDPDEPHHRAALAVTTRAEEAMTEILVRREHLGTDRAAALARTVTAVVFFHLAPAATAAQSVPEILAAVRAQLAAFLVADARPVKADDVVLPA